MPTRFASSALLATAFLSLGGTAQAKTFTVPIKALTQHRTLWEIRESPAFDGPKGTFQATIGGTTSTLQDWVVIHPSQPNELKVDGQGGFRRCFEIRMRGMSSTTGTVTLEASEKLRITVKKGALNLTTDGQGIKISD